MSAYPFNRRNPFTASKMPAATQRSIIWPPRHRLTFRFTSVRPRPGPSGQPPENRSQSPREEETDGRRGATIPTTGGSRAGRSRGGRATVLRRVAPASGGALARARSGGRRGAGGGQGPRDRAGEFTPLGPGCAGPSGAPRRDRRARARTAPRPTCAKASTVSAGWSPSVWRGIP